MKRQSFTLIELLIVIATIGLLASLVIVSFPGATKKAKIAKTQRELQQIYESIIVAQYTHNDVLMHITGCGCSACACWSYGVDSPSCISNWENVAKKIDIPPGTRDGWGKVFLVDENELEFASNPCRKDWVRSPGPNQVVGGGDDIYISIPFYSEQCK